MKVLDNKTTRKDNNKYQTTNINYDQNSMSTIKKIITKSNSHQIKTKTKQFNLYFIGNDMKLVPNATGEQVKKRANRCELQIYFSIFEKKNFAVINVITYQLKSLKYSFISSKEAIETSH